MMNSVASLESARDAAVEAVFNFFLNKSKLIGFLPFIKLLFMVLRSEGR